MLEVSDLHAHYGRAHILQGVTLSAAKGELLTLLGRNGAGKSTTMKAIMGLVRPSAGHVRFEGVELRGTAHLHRTDRGREPGGRPPSRPPPSGGWTAERIYALFPNLAAMRARPGERMSGGEQQMLTIGRSLMGNPRLILLDESIEGLAPVIIERMADAILALKRDGMTLLLSEQNLHSTSPCNACPIPAESYQGSRRMTLGMTFSALKRHAESYGFPGSRQRPQRPLGRKT